MSLIKEPVQEIERDDDATVVPSPDFSPSGVPIRLSQIL